MHSWDVRETPCVFFVDHRFDEIRGLFENAIITAAVLDQFHELLVTEKVGVWPLTQVRK